MPKLIAGAVLLTVLAAASVPAAAQRRAATRGTGGPRYELGADLSAFYMKPSGVDGGIQIGLPVDVRMGFLTRKKLMWEGRLSFSLNSIGTTRYALVPGVNFLYQLKRGTGPYNLIRAPYVTGGAALSLFDNGGSSGSQFQLGGGVGKRFAFGSAATRLEGFLAYTFKGGGQPSNVAIGTRIGTSFWH